jgi:cyclophilin family peptidyl-prolyl cis-trans isomerase
MQFRKMLTVTSAFLIMAGILPTGYSAAHEEHQASTTKKVAPVIQQGEPAPAPEDLSAKRFAIRSKDNHFVTLETDFGKMTLELYRDVAPNHADSFLARSKDGFYAGTIFHRIIDNFMIQGGDPQGTGMGGASYRLKAEFNANPHVDGTLSMARSPDVNSASTQFFICLGRNRSTQSLDNQYTVFGQLVKGFDVLHKIGSVECLPNPGNPKEISKPKVDVFLRKAYESDADGNPLAKK